MELVYTGNIKNVYTPKNGSCLLKFNDGCTGKDGEYVEFVTLSRLFFA